MAVAKATLDSRFHTETLTGQSFHFCHLPCDQSPSNNDKNGRRTPKKTDQMSGSVCRLSLPRVVITHSS